MKNLIHSEKVVEQGEEEIDSELTADYILYESILENRPSYSVKVTLKGSAESATARDVTSDPLKARHIFEMIRRGGVTPCCLLEIVEDLIESVQELSPVSTLHENTL